MDGALAMTLVPFIYNSADTLVPDMLVVIIYFRGSTFFVFIGHALLLCLQPCC